VAEVDFTIAYFFSLDSTLDQAPLAMDRKRRRARKFTLFSKLPQENQDAIWEATLPSARFVTLIKESTDSWGEFEGDFEYYTDLYGHQELYSFQGLDLSDSLETYETIHGRDGKVHGHILSYRASTFNERCGEDTRSISEKDLLKRVHIYASGLDGSIKRQTQLKKYGFTSSQASPTIGHAASYDISSYEGYGDAQHIEVAWGRGFQSLVHTLGTGSDKTQQQLYRYGFKTSRPTPTIRNCCWWDYDLEELRIRYCGTSDTPAVLQVCKNSRQTAKRCGFALAFATRSSPARIWFNFDKDFLYLGNEDVWSFNNQIHPEERKRIRRVVLDFFQDVEDSSILPIDVLGPLVQQFQDLEELIILLMDMGKNRLPAADTEDWMFVDLSEAEILGPINEFTPSDRSKLEPFVLHFNEYHFTRVPFFEDLEHKVVTRLTAYRKATLKNGEPGWKIPSVRFALVTSAAGYERLQDGRDWYWQDKEDREIEMQERDYDEGEEEEGEEEGL
jgi:hypothetical protein